MCTKPRPHAELIKAWADGAVIQFWDGGWYDCPPNPKWERDCKYRVKPEPTDLEKYGVEVGDVWRTHSGAGLTVYQLDTYFIVTYSTRSFVDHTELKTLLFRRGVVNKFGG